MSFRFHLIMVIKFYLVLAFLLKCHGGDEEIRTPDPLLARQVLSQLSYTPIKQNPKVKRTNVLLRKEVIQPHLPIRLPCYDFTPVIDFALGNLFLDQLRAPPTSMVWRAVCTRPGNAFTAAFWSAITSNSGFMISSCRDQSELGSVFWGLLDIAI